MLGMLPSQEERAKVVTGPILDVTCPTRVLGVRRAPSWTRAQLPRG